MISKNYRLHLQANMAAAPSTRPQAILLDRDGVINFDSPDYILTPEQWQPIPGSLAAIARLTQAGIAVAIVSNQSALGRNMLDTDTFQAIHAKMLLCIEEAGGRIDHVAYCPHSPEDQCACRKPLAGMIHESLLALNLKGKPQACLMIGDSLRDIQAAHAAQVRGILVQSGYGNADEIHAQAQLLDASTGSFPDLATAIDYILEI